MFTVPNKTKQNKKAPKTTSFNVHEEFAEYILVICYQYSIRKYCSIVVEKFYQERKIEYKAWPWRGDSIIDPKQLTDIEYLTGSCFIKRLKGNNTVAL